MIHKCLLVLMAMVTLNATLCGQTLEEVAADREKKLEETLERLREVRQSIKDEQLPLARELNALDAEARDLETEVSRARRVRDNESVELEVLQSRVVEREKEVDHVTRSLLPTYVADYDAMLSAPERGGAGEAVRNYNLFLEKPDATELEKLERGLALMSESLEQVTEIIGGQTFEGEALSPDGTIRPGQFVKIGPLAYFASTESTVSGPAEWADSVGARVEPLGTKAAQSIATVARERKGTLPVDPTLGDALAVAQTKDSITGHLAKGGVWVYPILLFALVATIVAIFKAFQVFTIRHPQPMVIHEIVASLRKGNRDHAQKLARAQPQPARGMLMAAVDHADESTEMVEEVMYESLLTTQPKLERFLNVIAVTAAAAPLLGLLGTVTGIIKTFRLMTVFGAGDARPLISGISEALITTELGLILAIPSLVLHAILSRKVAGTMARLEKTAVTFVNGLSRTQVEKVDTK